jgi:hypothetical protein
MKATARPNRERSPREAISVALISAIPRGSDANSSVENTHARPFPVEP